MADWALPVGHLGSKQHPQGTWSLGQNGPEVKGSGFTRKKVSNVVMWTSCLSYLGLDFLRE